MFKRLVISLLQLFVVITLSQNLYASSLTVPHRPDEVQSANLQAYWKLSEASGTRIDSSVNAYDLTDNNTVGADSNNYWNLGENSASFVAANSESLTVPHATAVNLRFTTDNFTIGMWIKRNTISTQMGLAGKDDGANGYRFGINASNQLFFVYNNTTTFTASSALVANRWYYITVVHDYTNSRISFYVNGNVDAIVTLSSTIVESNAKFSVGFKGNGSEYYDGLMKDLAVWNTALSTEQVKSLAMGTKPADYWFRPNHSTLTTPTAFWKLNELSTGAGAVSRADSSGSHTLTDNNTVTNEGGYFEAAGARFTTANSEFLTAADSTDWDFGTGDFSYVTWVKFKSIGIWNALIAPTGTFVGSTDWFMVAVDDGNVLTVYTESTIATVSSATTDFKANTWYHLAVVRRSGTLYILLNGVQLHSVANTVDIQSPGAIDLGHWFSGGSHYYANIVLTDTAIWKGTGLTNAQIASLASGLPIQQSGMVSYYKLDETSGNAIDSKGTNTLTDNNTVGSTTGQVGNARDFIKANSEYLSIADGSQTGFDITTGMMAGFVWLKADLVTGQEGWISKGPGTSAGTYVIYGDGTNNIVGIIDTTTMSESGPPDAGIVYHMGFNVTGDVIEIVRNSTVTGSSTKSLPTLSNAKDFVLGAIHDTGFSAYFDGWMDEAVIFNRYLRPEEYTTLYMKGKNAKELTSTEASPSASRRRLMVVGG